ncbi:MAG TPA: hypothetical protein DDY37_00150 [Legionella sp.]|nr:hypothetical protein [Legionella sp.]
MTLGHIALVFQYHNRPKLHQRLIQQAPDSASLCVIVTALCASSASPNDGVLLAIAKHPKADDDVLSQVVNKMTTASQITESIRHARAGHNTYIAAQRNDNTPADALMIVVEKSLDQATWERCVQHPQANDDIFNVYLSKVTRPNRALLHLMAEKSSNADVLNSLLVKETDEALLVKIAQNPASDACLLHAIVYQHASTAICQAAMNHARADESVLIAIVNQSSDAALLGCVLQKNAAESILRASVGNPCADDTVLALIANKTVDSKLIKDVVFHCGANAETYAAAVANPKIDLLGLIQVAQRSTTPEAQVACVHHALANDSVLALIAEKTNDSVLLEEAVHKTAAGEVTYAMAVKNKALNRAILLAISNKSTIAKTLEDCILHELANDGVDEILDIVLTKTANNDLAMIEKIAVKATDTALLGRVLEKNASESILGASVKNLHADDTVLSQISEKTGESECIALALAHSSAGERTYAAAIANAGIYFRGLMQVVQKSTDPATLLACARHALANEDVFRGYLSHEDPLISPDGLNRVAERSRDTDVLSSVLNKEPEEDVLLTIAQNQASDAALLCQIIHQNASAAILQAVMAHEQANDEVLALVAEKTNDPALWAQAVHMAAAGEATYAAAVASLHIDLADLIHIAQTSITPDTLLACIHHSRANHDVFTAYLSRQDNMISQDGLRLMAEESREMDVLRLLLGKEPDENVLVTLAQNPASDAALLCQIIHQNASAAILQAVMANAHADESVLALIAEKATDNDAIATLIQQASTAEHATFVTIAQNQHINTEQLEMLLLKLVEHDDDFKAIARQILETEFLATGGDRKNLPALNTSMNALRLKALAFLDAPETSGKNYKAAFKAAFSLYVALRHATTDYYANETIELSAFKMNVTQSIEKYKPELAIHRGLMGVLLDIVNAVVHGMNWTTGLTFSDFTSKTKALQITDDIRENVPPNRPE